MESSTTSFAPMGEGQQQSTSVTAPIVEVAPIRDTTNISSGGGSRPTTRIEGMEELEKDNAAKDDVENGISAEELSFYSNSENDHGDDNLWGLLSGVGGNIYEW